jgi:hypothetical protein
MERRHWVNSSHPQTLQIAVILLYANAALTLLFGGIGTVLFLPLLAVLAAGVAGGYGIANDRRWGYWLAVVVAALPLVYEAYLLFHYGLGTAASAGVITIIFQVALLALLLHPQSREYQRIWFK